jgi:rod shape-determining protein MreD
MRPGGRGVLVALFVALLLLHIAVRPLLDWRAEADFLLVGLLLVAVRVRPGAAALLGCATGLFLDALSPLGFGAGMLAGTVVAVAASRAKAAFFTDNVGLNALFLGVGKLAWDALYLVVERRLTGAGLLLQLGVWTPLSALVTALVGLVLLTLLRPVLEPPGPRW